MGVRLTVRSSWSTDAGSNLLVYEFDQERIVIGRSAGSDVRLPHHAVSGHHATIRVQGAGWVAVDEGSTNGTWVGYTRLAPKRPKPLRAGDVIQLGGFALRVEIGVPVTDATTVDRTSALARQLVRDLLDPGTEAATPRLFVLNGPEQDTTLDVPDPPVRLVIGRGEHCDLPLSDADASREHAEVERDLDGVVVRDLDSKNGVKVNGKRIRERRLRDRDEIAIGATVMVFEDAADARLTEVSVEPDVAMETPLWREEDQPEGPADPGAAAEPNAIPVQARESAPTATTDPDRRPARTPRGASADVFIYLLAGAVLALSIAGLVILLQSG